MAVENIKAKISIHWSGEARPFTNVEDYNLLKQILGIDEGSNHETRIQEIVVEDVSYEVENVTIEILKETDEDHMKYGIDLALQGDPMPYNLRVSIFLTR